MYNLLNRSVTNPPSACARYRRLARSAGVFLLLFFGLTAAADEYYSVQDLVSGEVVRRGTSSDRGIVRGELILAPNSFFRVWVYDSDTQLIGYRDFQTPQSGFRFSIGSVPLQVPLAADSDGDGLDDEAEFVLGTDPGNPDTDGDGVTDGAAILQGLNPAAGAVTGIVGSVGTSGFSQDVAAFNDIVVVANGSTGVQVFNVFNQMAPLILAVVDTPGSAQAVAIDGSLIAVADGAAGLAIIDISDPTTASILHQVTFGAAAVAVTASAGVAYAALSQGQVVLVDLQTGTVLRRITVGPDLQDLRVGGDTLFVLSSSQIYSIPLGNNLFSVSGSTAVPGGAQTDRRLFVGTGIAYASHHRGYTVIDISVPDNPGLITDFTTGQIFWRQVVANGSGLALMAYNIVLNDPSQTINLHDVGSDGLQNQFVTGFGAPSTAEAVAIYNGQAFVAAGGAGLQVLNYLSTDTAGQPPAITLGTSASGNQTEEGKPVRLTAEVSDDVQVRNVEFYVDGVKVATDGNYPFEFRFLAPNITGGGSAFTVNARVSDTGGNFSWSTDINILLTPDITGPLVAGTIPREGGLIGSPDRITVFFNEPVAAGTVTPASLKVVGTGADEIPNTADDTEIDGGVVTHAEDGRTSILTLSSVLEAGVYSIQVTTTVTDVSGNPMVTPYFGSFRVISGTDTDGDGVPDDVEVLLGLDPDNPDSNADGIFDGEEDFDNDNLSNAGEFVMGTDPTFNDSDSDGIPDGLEDRDSDSINDGSETRLGLNPFKEDSDGDGWYDEAEITIGSDPLNPISKPLFTVRARPSILIINPSTDFPSQSFGTVFASPRTQVLNPASELPSGETIGTIVGQPNIEFSTETGAP